MKYQLILQFNGKTENDFDKLVEIEEKLEDGLHGIAEVDGHDFGSEEMNIFILTNEPKKIFASTQEILKNSNLFSNVRAAYRENTGSEYKILWPEDLDEFLVK